jgi:hypothetical protein
LLAALFLIAARRLVGIRIVRQKICLFGRPLVLIRVKVDVNMGCALSLDAGGLMVLIAYPVGKVSFADINGDPFSLVVLS